MGIAATQRRAQLQREKRIRNRLSKSNSKVTKSNSKVNLVEKQNEDLKKHYVQLKEQQAVECHQKRKREEEFTDLESSHAQLSSRFDERCKRYCVSTAKQRAETANARQTNKVLVDTLFVEVKAGKDKLTALSVEVKAGKDKLTDLESSHAQLSSRFDERYERYSVSTAKQRANMANARKTNKVLKDTLSVEVKKGKDKLTALAVEVKKGKDKLTAKAITAQNDKETFKNTVAKEKAKEKAKEQVRCLVRCILARHIRHIRAR